MIFRTVETEEHENLYRKEHTEGRPFNEVLI